MLFRSLAQVELDFFELFLSFRSSEGDLARVFFLSEVRMRFFFLSDRLEELPGRLVARGASLTEEDTELASGGKGMLSEETWAGDTLGGARP